MERGTTTFVCNNCGDSFDAADCELLGTVETAPMPCPKCGSTDTTAVGFSSFAMAISFVGSVMLFALAYYLVRRKYRSRKHKHRHLRHTKK